MHLAFALKKLKIVLLPLFEIEIAGLMHILPFICITCFLKCLKSFGDACIIFFIKQHSLPFLPLVTRNLLFSLVNYF